MQGCLHAPLAIETQLYLQQEEFSEVYFRPAQIAVLKGYEIVVDWKTGCFLYRPEGTSGSWKVSPIELNRPHAVAIGTDGDFYAVDTNNHRIIRFTDLDHGGISSIATIAGQPLRRPHDIVLEPREGFLYVIDKNYRLYRFRSFGVGESYIQFERSEIGYARSLSVVRDKVYVICSSKGQVLRIDDFEKRKLTFFVSPGKKKEVSFGSWETTGLVLNDVEFFNGYWYGTNFFTTVQQPDDPTCMYSLMRWRSWGEFELGRWEDLSHLLEAWIIPYQLTVHNGKLYLACLGGKVYIISERPDYRRRRMKIMEFEEPHSDRGRYMSTACRPCSG